MSIWKNSFITFASLSCILIVFANCQLDPDQDNVCSRPKVTLNFKKLQENCVKHNYKNSDIIECLRSLDYSENVEYFCCPGYEKFDDQCVPECDDCVHGTCIAPNVCGDCMIGFGGKNCGVACNSTDRFGKNCENDCKVILNPKLNNNFEFCESCNSTNYINSKCKDICKCRHVCSPGYFGKNCNLKCPSFKYGNLCSNDCKCVKNNTLTCNRVSGECKCMDLYYGELCDQYCNKTTSFLTCTNPHNCTCEFNLEYKLEKLKIDKQNLESEHLNKNNFYLIGFGILFSVMIILILLSIAYKYKLNQTKIRLNAIKFRNNVDEDKKKLEFKNINLNNYE